MSQQTVTLTCNFNATGSLHIYNGTATWLNPEFEHLIEVDDPYTVDFVIADPASTAQTVHVWQRQNFAKWSHDGTAASSAVFTVGDDGIDAEFRFAVAANGVSLTLADFDGTLPGTTQSVKVKIKIRKKGDKPIS